MTSQIETLVAKVALALKHCGLKIAIAESCTGGGLSYWLTSVAGSSDWLERGFVTYSNQAKIEMLGVSYETLASFGAVSKEVAKEMAEGALIHSHADIGIAITGIAGPKGGSKEKPVGTVWIAFARRGLPTQIKHYLFEGNRETIRTKSIENALEKLLKMSYN